MKKTFFLIFLLLISLITFSQNATKKETQDWIKEKIELYPFNDGKTTYVYNVNFDSSSIIINEELTLDIGGHFISKITIPLKNLMQVTFEENISTIWMIFKIRNNKNEIKRESITMKDIDYISTHQIILQKSIDSEKLRPRLTDAFKHLIKLYGGIVVKEKF